VRGDGLCGEPPLGSSPRAGPLPRGERGADGPGHGELRRKRGRQNKAQCGAQALASARVLLSPRPG